MFYPPKNKIIWYYVSGVLYKFLNWGKMKILALFVTQKYPPAFGWDLQNG